MNAPEPSPIDFDELRRQAREVAQRAYSPYSSVQVGAALLGANGQVFTGCNVENASYGA
ncbi:MAG TPA: cytidine deaminase, partial [Planctomycetes bacterium]|nr:cytidine deaminase [Planctomycetota bacterium]